MSVSRVFIINRFNLFSVIILMCLFVGPISAQNENSENAQPELQVSVKPDVLLGEITVLDEQDSKIPGLFYPQEQSHETVSELQFTIFIAFSVCLLIIFILVIYLLISFTSKKRLTELTITINHLKSELSVVNRKNGKNSDYHPTTSISPEDFHELKQDVNGLKYGLEIIRREIKEGSVNSLIEDIIDTPAPPEVLKELKGNVDKKIEQERELSVLLSNFISKLGRTDSEVTNYIQALHSVPKTKLEYESVDVFNMNLSKKFQNYIELVDINNEEQIFLVNKLAEKFDIGIINPAKAERFDAKLHSAISEEGNEDVQKSRVLRVEVLGYQGAQRSLVKAKVILSRG